MMLRFTVIVGFAATVLGQSALAEDRIAPRVERTELDEVVHPTDISERYRAVYGLMVDTPDSFVRYPTISSKQDPEFEVFGVSSRGGNLCVDIQRAEGGYHAHFIVKAPKGNGPVRVIFDSKPEARSLLSRENIAALELGLRVSPQTRKGVCSPESALLPASWREQELQGQYQLLVGGGSFGTPALKVDNGDIQDCKPLAEAVGRPDLGAGAYGFSCAFSKTSPPCLHGTKLQILWFQGNRLVDQVDMSSGGNC
jgi:hypothetical protein